jgi:glyceraldehyde 3-phosphate dehydrogenase
MSEIRVAINGFGRIGRSVIRAAKKMNADINFVAINDLVEPDKLATVLKYDSVHGIYPGDIEIINKNILTVDGDHIKCLSIKDPKELPWDELDIHVVIEATGLFRLQEELNKHLSAGSRRVILTVPPKDSIDATVVLGVNDHILTGNEKIVSNVSCTTNCAAVLCKPIHENLGIKEGYLITVHAYTMGQRLLDYPHRDMRRARAAGLSIIPTTTGAAKMLGEIIPDLKGKIDGISYRVPVPDGSVVDMALELETDVTVEEIHTIMKTASETYLEPHLQYSTEPIVSVDIVGNPYSAIYDAPLTKVLRNNFIKITGWYDNESGYANRVVDLTLKMGHYELGLSE